MTTSMMVSIANDHVFISGDRDYRRSMEVEGSEEQNIHIMLEKVH